MREERKKEDEEIKSEIGRFYTVDAETCARYLQSPGANFGIRRSGRFYNPRTSIISELYCTPGERRAGESETEKERRLGREKRGRERKKRPISSAVEFHERAIAADVRSAEELCGREIP